MVNRGSLNYLFLLINVYVRKFSGFTFRVSLYKFASLIHKFKSGFTLYHLKMNVQIVLPNSQEQKHWQF